MVLPWDGPAPALTRGASTGRSEDRCYASWRELCDGKLSIYEPREGEELGEGGLKPSSSALQIVWAASTRAREAADR